MKKPLFTLCALTLAGIAAAFFVFPNLITVVRGRWISGGVDSLMSDDDNRFVVQTGPKLTPYDSPLDVQFDALCSTDQPRVLILTLESSANALGLVQYVEMWEWSSNSWVPVDTRPLTRSYSTATVNIPTCWRFAKPGTGQMRLRYWVSNSGPVSIPNWSVGIDRLVWDVDPQ